MVLPVKKIMRTKVAICTDSATVFDAVKVLKKFNTSTVVVLNAKKAVIGVFSERDLVNKVVYKKLNPEKTKVLDVMTSPVICGSINQTDVDIAALITKKHIKKIPILDEDKLVGIVAEHDILVSLADSVFNNSKIKK